MITRGHFSQPRSPGTRSYLPGGERVLRTRRVKCRGRNSWCCRPAKRGSALRQKRRCQAVARPFWRWGRLRRPPVNGRLTPSDDGFDDCVTATATRNECRPPKPARAQLEVLGADKSKAPFTGPRFPSASRYLLADAISLIAATSTRRFVGVLPATEPADGRGAASRIWTEGPRLEGKTNR